MRGPLPSSPASSLGPALAAFLALSCGARADQPAAQAAAARETAPHADAALPGDVTTPQTLSAPRVGSGDDLADRAAFRARMAAMLDAVHQHYVDDKVTSQQVVYGAIAGMLDTLDPHTHFLDAEAFKAMREGQDGSFYGLGIIISVRRDSKGKLRLTVISPIDGMPAKRLGVRPGDIIAAIEGQSTDNLALDEAVSRLRGEKGSSVNITIERDGERFDLAVERAQIPTESVPQAYMIRPDTGFVRVKDFTKTTTRELSESIRRLRGEGMKRMVLDLRDNPGGLLDEAVSVSSLFLDENDMVVETRGRIPGSTETRRTVSEADRLPADIPLIVLTNRGTASASEIVSGAIQDHDRGLIVGGTTWGKGLVQSVYNLTEGCGLALTTARYYTPSGRQIQRDYRSSYYDYYMPKKDAAPHGEQHVTDGGRKVFSGGGIEPDIRAEEEKPLPLTSRIVGRSLPFRFAARHLAAHPGTVKPGYDLSAQDLTDFRTFVEADKTLHFTDAQWKEALPQVRVQLLHDIVNAHLGDKEAFKVLMENDRQVQSALALWPHATREALIREAHAREASATPAAANGPG